MATNNPFKERLRTLKQEYDTLRPGKEALLQLLDEAEIPESVYNSNAIENSTLTLKETEKILLEMEVSRNVSLREVFEAKNLARIVSFIKTKSQETEMTQDLMLFLHQMLLGNINDNIAGRFRKKSEYVRVGTHIAPPPEQVQNLISSLLIEYSSNLESYFLDKIAKFHLDFETIHPFVDGNGRMGRVLLNYQLFQLHFPGIIIHEKEKKTYYSAFTEYRTSSKTKTMEHLLGYGLMEALHKRLAYLRGETVVPLVDYGRAKGKSVSALLNAARRQTIPAFRERGVWKIGKARKRA